MYTLIVTVTIKKAMLTSIAFMYLYTYFLSVMTAV